MDAIDRRAALALGGATLAAGAVAAAPAREVRAAGVLVFDPQEPAARAIAAEARGQRLVALAGDPVRLWRDALGRHDGPLHGATRWSDYLVLRGLAEERGLRIRSEVRLPAAAGPLIVRWSMA